MRFRNSLAEQGMELSPSDAHEVWDVCQHAIATVRNELDANPNFYNDFLNFTTEQKWDHIRILREEGLELSYQQYNDYRKVILHICEQELNGDR